MTPDDGHERLLGAIEALAASADTIQRRLEVAGITLLPLRREDFNDPANGAFFETIISALTSVGDPGEHGDLALSTFAMSEETAVKVAGMIVELHRRVFPW